MKNKLEPSRLGLFKPIRKILMTMKVFFLLFLVTISQVYAIDLYAQKTKISLDFSATTVSDILNEIEEKTEFNFFYNNKLIDVERKVDIEVNNEDIYRVLEGLFKDTDVKYVVEGKHIVLSNQLQKETLNSMQTIKVKGHVLNSINEPIVGATVVAKGTTTGTITDINGNYSLINLPNDAVLVFSFIGMQTKEVAVDRPEINVVLLDDIYGLEEVVAIGYGTMKKVDVTGAVSSVKRDDFIQGSVQDIGQLIQGKVAGLTIYSVSGDPTANTQIRLRGNTTLEGTNSNPLILIDGIPGDFNSVAPEDIESVDVLKDGSAAAIYGTQGSNGVIIITTKRASGNFVHGVEYSGYVNTQTIAKKLEMSTAADVRQQIADGFRSEAYDQGDDTDWLGEITRIPVSNVHNLTLRGGNTETNYLINLNFKKLQGIMLKSDNNVANFRADVNHSMFNNLIKLNMGVISRHTNYQTSGDGYSFNGYTYRQANIYNPTAPIKNEDGNWNEEPGAFNYDNPVARLEESDGENSSQWNRINGRLEINPLEGLKLSALLSYSKYDQTRGYYETKNHISTVRYGLNGYGSNGATQSIDRLLELTASYSKSIDHHRFTALGGYSYKDYDNYLFWQRNTDFPTDQFGYNRIDLGKGILEAADDAGIYSERSKTNLIAFFGRGTYNYDDKYLLMGSLRYEAASQLYGTNNPWGLFPAVSAGWRISKEPFMENLNFISDLKLRVGYGVTGTQPRSLFLGVATLAYDDFFYSNGEWKKSLAPSRNPNPNLRWEEKKETNIGLDYAFFDGRINGTVDYYVRRIDGLLLNYQVPVPPNLVATTLANVGIMDNKGMEVQLNIIPVKTKDFQWTSSVNYSTNKNELVTLSNDLYEHETGYIEAGGTGEPIQTYTHRTYVGGEIGNFYGFKVVDVTDEGRWVYEDANGAHATVDEGFAKVDSNKMVLGNGLPRFYAGWNNTFRYKNFDLSITMRGAFDFQILNFERMYLENTQTIAYNRLQSAYDNVFDKAVLSTAEDLEFNSYYVEDGDYWKIENITLGYNFKMDKVRFIKSARLYISSLNTLVLTGYKGIDPEIQIDGLEPGNDYRDKYPTTRTFTIGFNVNF